MHLGLPRAAILGVVISLIVSAVAISGPIAAQDKPAKVSGTIKQRLVAGSKKVCADYKNKATIAPGAVPGEAVLTNVYGPDTKDRNRLLGSVPDEPQLLLFADERNSRFDIVTLATVDTELAKLTVFLFQAGNGSIEVDRLARQIGDGIAESRAAAPGGETPTTATDAITTVGRDFAKRSKQACFYRSSFVPAAGSQGDLEALWAWVTPAVVSTAGAVDGDSVSAVQDADATDTAQAAPPDPFTAELQAVIDDMPDLGGDDTEQIQALMGPPDAFTIAFEPRQDGSVSRREQWFYYDLSTVFEFMDGAVIWDLPLADEVPFLIHPVRYDPADFLSGATWESLASVVGDPAVFEAVELDAEYGVPATVYVGELLLLTFDEDGELFYVETVPLTPGVEA